MSRILFKVFVPIFVLVHSQGFGFSSDLDKVSSDQAVAWISASQILDRLEQSMSGIQDLHADMAFHILIKKLGFPFTVHADYYFKVPDKVKIALRGLPGLVLGDAPKTITAATTLTGFRKDYQKSYRSKVVGIRKLDGRNCYYIDLTPIDDGNVARTFLWVDEKNFTIPKLMTNYKDGSWIQVRRIYGKFQNHLLVSHIEASMDFVKSDLQASVSADYEKYRLNQGLDDTIFDDGKIGDRSR